jgi:hypothetical protein
MRLPLLDTALWAAGPVLNAALLCVIILRRRLRAFPMLASWCIYTIVSMAALFFTYRLGSDHTYAVVYWFVDGLDALLQIAVITEVAHIVFRPDAAQNQGIQLAPLIAVAALLSFAIVWWIHPTSPTRAGVWEIRGDLFTSLIVSMTFTLVLLMSQRQGLHWRFHVMSIGYGLMVWAVVTLIIGLLHGYWGRYNHYVQIEHVRMLVYHSMLCYWIFALWRDEPEKEQPSREMREAILHLTDKVSYDLAKVLGTRGKEFH